MKPTRCRAFEEEKTGGGKGGIPRLSGFGDVTASDLAHRYLWNPAAVDQLLADEQIATPAAAGEVLWALTDHLGSVRDVVGSNGTLRIHKNFDSFGNVLGETHFNSNGTLVTSGAGYVDTAFGFTGRFFDDETGLQNNLHRWYDASVGRWVSKDPIGFAGGDANLYRYVGNSPGMYVDPNGLFGDPWTVGQIDNAERSGRDYDPHRYTRTIEDIPITPMDRAVASAWLGGSFCAGAGFAAFGGRATAAFVAEEAAEAVVEEVTGVPIIVDPGDIVEGIAKRTGRRAFERAPNPGGISSNPANRRIDVPDKNGRLTRRHVRISPADEQKYCDAVADRYNQLLGETPSGLSEAEKAAWRHQRMNDFRREWLDRFYKERDY